MKDKIQLVILILDLFEKNLKNKTYTLEKEITF